jgi:CubicO group peptidase (beta-lactamase class C family)
LNVTARDYARFGQMIAQGGEWQGRQVVPRDWVEESTVEGPSTYVDGVLPGAAVGEGYVALNSGYGLYFHEPGNLFLVFGPRATP